jgi:hypothetical protein
MVTLENEMRIFFMSILKRRNNKLSRMRVQRNRILFASRENLPVFLSGRRLLLAV